MRICQKCKYEAKNMYDEAEHAVHIHSSIIEHDLVYYGMFNIENLFKEDD